jgi:hypothetical protein
LVFWQPALEPELLSNPEQFVLAAAKLTGEPDVLRSFFKQLSQEFAPSESLFAQIFSL